MKTTEIKKGIFITNIDEKDISLAIQKVIEKEQLKKNELLNFISNPSNEYKPSNDCVPF